MVQALSVCWHCCELLLQGVCVHTTILTPLGGLHTHVCPTGEYTLPSQMPSCWMEALQWQAVSLALLLL